MATIKKIVEYVYDVIKLKKSDDENEHISFEKQAYTISKPTKYLFWIFTDKMISICTFEMSVYLQSFILHIKKPNNFYAKRYCIYDL